jgi:acyl-CoA synthetase (AMP-forming)/AMP-acid ligase II
MPEHSLEFENFQSIVQLISVHARHHGSRDAIIFLERGELESERISYRDLDAQTDRIAAGLLEAGLDGKPIMIALPAGSAFIAAFLGCLRVGAVAIPAPIPDTDRNIGRIAAILSDAQPAAILTDEASALRLAKIDAPARIVVFDELSASAAAVAMPAADPGRHAFVQYTSGSTRAPKGIVITHGNLIANQEMIRAAFEQDSGIVCVSWLPHFHDMGLFGSILQPLFNGGTAVIMSPRAFIQKPLRWLRAIDKYHGTIAGGPSFGYELCTRMISPEEAPALDLSSWRVAFCGAEPVRAAVLAKFAERFRPAKFRHTSLVPCYGLAETTLIASSVAPGTGVSQKDVVVRGANASRRSFVSCGWAVAGSSIVLRDENGGVHESGEAIGEICIGGPHVSPGHWDASHRSVSPFENVFLNAGKQYLPTGDIGAFVDGELFPIDRISDIIILFGANIHATDIEATVLDDSGSTDIRSAVAFAVDDGNREKLVVLCELDRQAFRASDQGAMAERLRKCIAEVHGVVPLVGFVLYGALPRTSSGKIQRSASKRMLLSDQAPMIKVDAETEIAISKLRSIAESDATHPAQYCS